VKVESLQMTALVKDKLYRGMKGNSQTNQNLNKINKKLHKILFPQIIHH
jgi:hypothetical protein